MASMMSAGAPPWALAGERSGRRPWWIGAGLGQQGPLPPPGTGAGPAPLVETTPCVVLGKWPEDYTFENWKKWSGLNQLLLWRNDQDRAHIYGCPKGQTPWPDLTAILVAPAAPNAGNRCETGSRCAAPPAQGTPPGQPPATPAVAVDAAQAGRLLNLMETAKRAVDQAMAKGTAPGATDADKAAGDAVKACLEQLIRAAGDFDAAHTKLQAAAQASQGAAITAPQADAIQAFADCAMKATAAGQQGASPGGLLQAVVGVGLPAAGALLVAV